MSARTIANRVKAAALAAGTEGRFAGLTELQVAGRWQSATMPALYARNQLAGRGAVAKYLA